MKVIYTADDFGPCEFINEGIIEMVERGFIRSVQVISNQENKNELESELRRLYTACDGKKIELGVHLTLTSGRPLCTRNLDLEDVKDKWGDLVDKNGLFRNYKSFPTNHTKHIDLIEREFKAQITQLHDLIKLIDPNKERFNLVSASGHHNFFQLTHELHTTYLKVLRDPNVPLISRSPKAIPDVTNRRFFNRVMMIFNFSDDNVFRQMVSVRIHLLQQNKYPKDPGLDIQTPNYLDIRYYENLGSLWWWGNRKGQITKRINLFESIHQEARKYVLNPYREEADKPLIIEMMFHLGKHTEKTKGKRYKNLTNGYNGITPSYFDNRLAETEALRRIIENPEQVKLPHASWKECQRVLFEGNF